MSDLGVAMVVVIGIAAITGFLLAALRMAGRRQRDRSDEER